MEGSKSPTSLGIEVFSAWLGALSHPAFSFSLTMLALHGTLCPPMTSLPPCCSLEKGLPLPQGRGRLWPRSQGLRDLGQRHRHGRL